MNIEEERKRVVEAFVAINAAKRAYGDKVAEYVGPIDVNKPWIEPDVSTLDRKAIEELEMLNAKIEDRKREYDQIRTQYRKVAGS